MKKSNYVDTKELDKRCRSKFLANGYSAAQFKDRKNWTKTTKDYYQLVRSTIYHQMRREAAEKSANFWLKTFDVGHIKNTLAKHGLKIDYRNRVYADEAGALIIKKYLEEVVLPELEEIGITGIEIAKRPSGCSRSLLIFSKAKVVTTEPEKKGETND